VTARITSQVANFYPMLRGWGWFSRIGRFVYRYTQLQIHIIVTNRFLRSLANLDLAPSVVGDLRGSTPGVPDDEEFEALRRLWAERRSREDTAKSSDQGAAEQPPPGREAAV